MPSSEAAQHSSTCSKSGVICPEDQLLKLEELRKNVGSLEAQLAKIYSKNPGVVKEESKGSVDTIPCDLCGENVPIELYTIHTDEHSAKHRQVEEEKAVAASIPCEICGASVAFSEYETHVVMHQQPPPAAVAAPGSVPVPTASPVNVPGVKLPPPSQSSEVQNCPINPPVAQPPHFFSKQPEEPGIECTVCKMKVPIKGLLSHLDTHREYQRVLIPPVPSKEESKSKQYFPINICRNRITCDSSAYFCWTYRLCRMRDMQNEDSDRRCGASCDDSRNI